MSEPQPLFNRITYARPKDAPACSQSAEEAPLLGVGELQPFYALKKRFLDHGIVFRVCRNHPGNAIHLLFYPTEG